MGATIVCGSRLVRGRRSGSRPPTSSHDVGGLRGGLWRPIHTRERVWGGVGRGYGLESDGVGVQARWAYSPPPSCRACLPSRLASPGPISGAPPPPSHRDGVVHVLGRRACNLSITDKTWSNTAGWDHVRSTPTIHHYPYLSGSKSFHSRAGRHRHACAQVRHGPRNASSKI